MRSNLQNGAKSFCRLIWSRKTRSLVRFMVLDTGIGIRGEEQRFIFEAFSQADASSTRKFSGTGLGLTIAARLVSIMGGRIWVESEPGRGSAFHFTAPFKRVREGRADL